MMTAEFVDACLSHRVEASVLMDTAPPELREIIRDSLVGDSGNDTYMASLCAKTYCLQHMHVFVHQQLCGSVELDVLARRPHTVRLYCLLHDDGIATVTKDKAILKALKLPESQIALNAATVKTARDFVKQLTNRDDRKKTRVARA